MDNSTSGMVGKQEESLILRSPGENQFYANAGQRPHPRRTKRVVPTEEKDDRYWEKRKRNNEAARRSRENKRRLDFDMRGRTAVLEEENALLRNEIKVLKSKFGLAFDQRFTGLDKHGELLSEPIAVKMPSPDLSGMCPVSPPSVHNGQHIGTKDDILASPLNSRYEPSFTEKEMNQIETKYENHQNGKLATPVKGSPPPYYPHPAYPYAGTYWGSPPQAHSQSHLLSSPQMARTAHYPPMPGAGVMSSFNDAFGHSHNSEKMHSHENQLHNAHETHSINPVHFHPNSSPVNANTQSSFYDYQPNYYHVQTPDKQTSHSESPADLRNKPSNENNHFPESDSSQDGMSSDFYSENLKIGQNSTHITSGTNIANIVPNNCNKANGSEKDLCQEKSNIHNHFHPISAEVHKMNGGVSPHLPPAKVDHC